MPRETSGISSTAFTDVLLAMDIPQITKINQYCSRPTGFTHLGVPALNIPAALLELEGKQVDVLMDTGATMTIMSSNTYDDLPHPKPKVKNTKTYTLKSAAGPITTLGYVLLPIFFETKGGPIELEVEFHLIKDLHWPIIFSNDFQEQYMISILRSSDGTKIQFGPNPKHYIEAANSLTVSEEIRNLLMAMETRKEIIKSKNPWPKDNQVRVKETTVIPKDTRRRIPVEVHWPKHQEELYIESIHKYTDSGESYYVSEGLMSKHVDKLLVINPSHEDRTLMEGEILGIAHNPYDWLDKEVPHQHTASINALKVLMEPIPPLEIAPPGTLEDEEQDLKVLATQSDPVKKEELLKTVNINPHLNPDQRKQMENLIRKNIDVFSLEGEVGDPDYTVEINLKEGAEPVKKKPYHASPKNREAIDAQIKKWVEQKIIEPSKSPWGFPVIVVWKNEKPRICIDYRDLNSKTIPDSHPIPRPADIKQALYKAKWLTTMDGQSGFHHLKIADKDKEKTAFVSGDSQWQFGRLPFGVMNGPPAFQRVMNEVLQEFLWLFVFIYIDDIIVHSQTYEQHLDHLDRVFRALINARFKLSPKKCFFAYQSLKILGEKVSRLGMQTHEEKVEAINRVPRPNSLNELQTFLGLAVYYSQFIPFYSILAAPLFKLLKGTAKELKKEEWKKLWGIEQELAMDNVKAALTTAPVLAFAQESMGYRIYTDASLIGLSAILQQVQPIQVRDLKGTKTYEKLKKSWQNKEKEPPTLYKKLEGEKISRPQIWGKTFDGTWVWVERTISYSSRTLTGAEKYYSATELEALALAYGLKKNRHIIEGEKITHIGDHAANIYIETFQNLNARLRKLGLQFREYDIYYVHRPGKIHLNADPLSRIPVAFKDLTQDLEVPLDLDSDHKDKKAQEWLAYTYGEVNATITEFKPNPELIGLYSKYYQEDPYTRKIFQELKEQSKWETRPIYYIGDNGLLYYTPTDSENRLIVPRKLQKETVKQHDWIDGAAHQGVNRTYLKLAQHYYWPRMIDTVENYVSTCDLCQKNKYKNHSPFGIAQPLPIPQRPWEFITMDWIPDLPTTKKGNNCVYTIIDKLTKEIVAKAIHTTYDETQTAEVFRKEILTKKGVPKKVLSDRDARWRESFWKEVCQNTGMERLLTTSHHPQTDGQSEAANKFIEYGLRAFCNEYKDNWDEVLDEFVWAYNTTPNPVSKISPFVLMHGFQPSQPNDVLAPRVKPFSTEKDSTKEYLENLETLRLRARDAQTVAQFVQAQEYNRKHRHKEFEQGDLVLVNPYSLKLSGKWQQPGRKLIQRWEGPIPIRRKMGPNTYELELPGDWDIHPIVNIAHLEEYKQSPPEYGLRPRLKMEKRTSNKKEWEVHEITNERILKRGNYNIRQYQFIWKYGTKEDGSPDLRPTNEWINEKDVHAEILVHQWNNKKQNEQINVLSKDFQDCHYPIRNDSEIYIHQVICSA